MFVCNTEHRVENHVRDNGNPNVTGTKKKTVNFFIEYTSFHEDKQMLSNSEHRCEGENTPSETK